MALQFWMFHGTPELEAAATLDAKHVVPGARGDHVRKIQRALNLLEAAALDIDGVYGPGTAKAVLAYKTRRKIINPAYQTQPDNIVGRMTIAALDADMVALSGKLQHVRSGTFGIRSGPAASPVAMANTIATGAPSPVGLIITGPDANGVGWADQVEAFTKNPGPWMPSKKVVMKSGMTVDQVVAFYRGIISQAGSGGSLIINVGHGAQSQNATPDPDVGAFDLGPDNSFRIAGRNCFLVGQEFTDDHGVVQRAPLTIPPAMHDPPFSHTEVFYGDPVPKPRHSQKQDDAASSSPGAVVRLANFAAYQDISAAFKGQKLSAVALITCVVGTAKGMLGRLAQDWGCPIYAYDALIQVGQASNQRFRVRLHSDSTESLDPSKSTNTPLAEITMPPSRALVVIPP